MKPRTPSLIQLHFRISGADYRFLQAASTRGGDGRDNAPGTPWLQITAKRRRRHEACDPCLPPRKCQNLSSAERTGGETHGSRFGDPAVKAFAGILDEPRQSYVLR